MSWSPPTASLEWWLVMFTAFSLRAISQTIGSQVAWTAGTILLVIGIVTFATWLLKDAIRWLADGEVEVTEI